MMKEAFTEISNTLHRLQAQIEWALVEGVSFKESITLNRLMRPELFNPKIVHIRTQITEYDSYDDYLKGIPSSFGD